MNQPRPSTRSQHPTEMIPVPPTTPSPASAGLAPPRRGLPVAVIGAVGGFVALVAIAAIVWMTRGGEQSAAENELARYDEHQHPIFCLAVSADGSRIATGGEDSNVLVWNAQSLETLHELGPHPKPVTAVDISVQGDRVATGCEDGIVRVWKVNGQQREAELAGDGNVIAVFFCPTQMHLLIARPGGVELCDLKTKARVWRQTILDGEVTSLALAADGLRFVAGDSSGKVRIGSLATGREVGRCSGHQGAVNGVAFSPVGDEALSCGEDGTIRLWDIGSQRERRHWQLDDKAVPISVAFSPGATRAATTDDRSNVCLWSCEDGALLQQLDGHTAAVTCGRFFPNGLILATGGEDDTIHLWRVDAPSSLEMQRLERVVEQQKQRVERQERYLRRIRLAQQLSDEGKLSEAQKEFDTAAQAVDRESLEYALAHSASETIKSADEKLRQYTLLMKAGKEAADREDFIEAQRQFKQATQISPEGKEAQEGYRKATQAVQLQEALGGMQIARRIGFVGALPERGALRVGKEFACLLPGANASPQDFAEQTLSVPPIGLATAPLAWDIKLIASKRIPSAEVRVRITVVFTSTSETIAGQEYPLDANAEFQTLHGEAAPSPGGWKAGAYEVRSEVVLDGRAKPLEKPQSLAIGLIHWKETNVTLAPSEVQDANFAYRTSVLVERGDALAIRAEGSVAPAPIKFYRELTGQPDLGSPVHASPTGLKWSPTVAGGQHYGLVALKSNYSALLMRVGLSGWIAYRDDMLSQIVPDGGPLELSINSVIQYRPKDLLPLRTVAAGDRTYWQLNSGDFRVTVYHGTFDLPEHIPPEVRLLLARRFDP